MNYKKALFSDEMTDSVSYADIADVVVKTATENTFNLLERLAGEVFKNIFDRFPEIENIKLKINKPAAACKTSFWKCGVEVKISREEFYRYNDYFSIRNQYRTERAIFKGGTKKTWKKII